MSSTAKSFCLANAKFIDCESASVNTAVHVSISAIPSSFTLTNLKFTRTVENSPAYNIYISTSVLCTSFLNSSVAARTSFSDTIESTYTPSQVPYFWVDQSIPSNSRSLSILYLLFPPTESPFYVSGNGIDTDTCGWRSFPCKTINKAYSHDTLPTSIQLLTDGGTHTTESLLTTISRTLTVSKETETPSTPKKTVSAITGAAAVFRLTSGTIQFSAIDFLLDTASIVACPVFAQTGGSLSLQSISISAVSVVSLSAPLITVSSASGSTILASCAFENVSLRSGSLSGAVISADLGSTGSLQITGETGKNSTFTKCTSTVGTAGAVFVKLSHVSATLSVGYATFTDCTSPTQTGGSVYVDSLVDVVAKITINNWSNQLQPSDAQNSQTVNAYWVVESYTPDIRQAFKTSILSLLFSLNTPPVYLSATGFDFSSCGWQSLLSSLQNFQHTHPV